MIGTKKSRCPYQCGAFSRIKAEQIHSLSSARHSGTGREEGLSELLSYVEHKSVNVMLR